MADNDEVLPSRFEVFGALVVYQVVSESEACTIDDKIRFRQDPHKSFPSFFNPR